MPLQCSYLDEIAFVFLELFFFLFFFFGFFDLFLIYGYVGSLDIWICVCVHYLLS